MKVVRRVKAPTLAGGSVDIFEMAGGEHYRVNHHGWILDNGGAPLPHPLVDEVMIAILEFEKQVGE